MAKSPDVVKTPVVPSPPVPETQDLEVVVIRPCGGERFDVCRGVAKIDMSQLKVVEPNCSLSVALGTRKTEQAKLNIRLLVDPLDKAKK